MPDLLTISTAGRGWEWLREFREARPVRCAIGLRHVTDEMRAAIRARAVATFNLKSSTRDWILFGVRNTRFIDPATLESRLWIDPTRGFLVKHEEGGPQFPTHAGRFALPTRYVQRTGEGRIRSFDLPRALMEGSSRSRVFGGVGAQHGEWRGHQWLFRRSAGTTMSKRLYTTIVKGRSKRIPGMGGLKMATRKTVLRARPIQRRDIRPLFLLARQVRTIPKHWWVGAVQDADPIEALRRWLVDDIERGAV